MISIEDVKKYNPELDFVITEESDIIEIFQLDSQGIITFIDYLKKISKLDFFANGTEEEIKSIKNINCFYQK
tara:strand:- start:142 stop:357 length:216 start_codon:yes stop_codon:yes gene_type:complete